MKLYVCWIWQVLTERETGVNQSNGTPPIDPFQQEGFVRGDSVLPVQYRGKKDLQSGKEQSNMQPFCKPAHTFKIRQGMNTGTRWKEAES